MTSIRQAAACMDLVRLGAVFEIDIEVQIIGWQAVFVAQLTFEKGLFWIDAGGNSPRRRLRMDG